jgi:hypothetical protein
MADLWHMTQGDHDEVWRHLNALTGGGRPALTEPKERRQTAYRLVALISQHELTEQLVLWPAIRRACADGTNLADRGLGQESELKWAANELARLSPSSNEFTECANTVAGLCRRHFAFEENQAWPQFAGTLTRSQADRLAGRWHSARHRAAPPPHPHLPAWPVTLATVGPVAAVVDRARDALTGR